MLGDKEQKEHMPLGAQKHRGLDSWTEAPYRQLTQNFRRVESEGSAANSWEKKG